MSTQLTQKQSARLRDFARWQIFCATQGRFQRDQRAWIDRSGVPTLERFRGAVDADRVWAPWTWRPASEIVDEPEDSHWRLISDTEGRRRPDVLLVELGFVDMTHVHGASGQTMLTLGRLTSRGWEASEVDWRSEQALMLLGAVLR